MLLFVPGKSRLIRTIVVVRFLTTAVRLLLPSVTNSLSLEPEGVVERPSVVADITIDVRN